MGERGARSREMERSANVGRGDGDGTLAVYGTDFWAVWRRDGEWGPGREMDGVCECGTVTIGARMLICETQFRPSSHLPRKTLLRGSKIAVRCPHGVTSERICGRPLLGWRVQAHTLSPSNGLFFVNIIALTLPHQIVPRPHYHLLIFRHRSSLLQVRPSSHLCDRQELFEVSSP